MVLARIRGVSWRDFFRANFCKAVDGPVRDLKLGVDEISAIQILENDNMQHNNLLISEANLQACGLSKLGEDGITFT